MWLTLSLVFLVILVSLAYSKYRQNYWASRDIPTFPKSLPFLGHFIELLSKKRHRWEFVDEVYRNNRGAPLVGFYELLTPSLMVMDPDIAKSIFIKDFDHFVDRRNFKFPLPKDDVFNHFLTNATGEHWKGVRSVLSPSFTSGRMKGMFPLVAQKSDALNDYIHKKIKEKDSSIIIKKTLGFYTLEVIASCAFGIEAGCFKDENAEFNKKVAEMGRVRTRALVKFIAFMIVPRLCQALRISFLEGSMKFFVDVVKNSIAHREAGHHRGDFLDLMLEARKDLQDPSSKIPKYPLTENNIVANSVLFILAGFDTTSNTMAFLIFLLAKHPDVQEKLREEVKEIVKEHGELTYQGVMEAKLLEACLSETLRLYALAHVTERKCTKEYKVPGTGFTVPEGMVVSIPIYSIHHDEKYWPEPEEFRPERFLPENKDSIKSGTFLPFGIGPRNCIGMRFAQMEAKLATAKLLLDFEISCAPGYEQMKFMKQPGIMRPDDDFEVVFKPLKK